MKYQAVVDAAVLEQGMELGGRRGAVGDYLVAGDGSGFVFLSAATFNMLFRPVNGGAPAKAAREPKEAAEEPGRKGGEIGRKVLQCLKEGPKIVAAVADWMRIHGYPGYGNRAAGLALGYQARRGHCELGKDRLWRLKG